MKKILSIILSVLFLFVFVGCSSNSAAPAKDEISSNGETYTDKVTLSDGAYIVKDYTNGILTKESHYYSDGTLERTIEYLEYNKKGALIKKHTHYSNGSAIFCYDDNGNTIETIEYDADGNVDFSAKWEYDKNGNNTTFSKFNEDGILVLYEEFDENGNRTKEINYNDDGSLSAEFTFEYNSLGKIVKKTDYYAQYDSHKYYIYEYNSDNRLIKRYYYIDNDILERIREYDPETGMQINETFYNTDEN